jgi:hypothetical protein
MDFAFIAKKKAQIGLVCYCFIAQKFVYSLLTNSKVKNFKAQTIASTRQSSGNSSGLAKA